ncbi:MAG: NAD(P)H-dependent oxidoreductase [Rhodococcus sp.]|nr:NAD(P)H-dependent oxidoreductase [Rhodococcus sp. (in: high G+C Gram-positive bacteria)]
MREERLRVEVIIGSVREGRIGPRVAEWIVDHIRARPEFDCGVIDLVDAALPMDFSSTPETEAFRRRIDRADAFVVVTAEYNHGYPAALKTAFDTLKYEWRGKPVGFVSYGGPAGGVRAVEQLRQVVAELHMVSVRQSIGFQSARKQLAAAEVDAMINDSAQRMLDQLTWWANATRTCAATSPYPG